MQSSRFGQWLKAQRAQRGMAQADLASAGGLSQGMVSNLERGLRNPSRANVEKLTRALGADNASALLAAGFSADRLPGASHSSKEVHDTRIFDAGWSELSPVDQAEVLDWIVFKRQRAAQAVPSARSTAALIGIDAARPYALAAYKGELSPAFDSPERPIDPFESKAKRRAAAKRRRESLAAADAPDE